MLKLGGMLKKKDSDTRQNNLAQSPTKLIVLPNKISSQSVPLET